MQHNVLLCLLIALKTLKVEQFAIVPGFAISCQICPSLAFYLVLFQRLEPYFLQGEMKLSSIASQLKIISPLQFLSRTVLLILEVVSFSCASLTCLL
ncbi:MAG: hypothetical protein EZS28_003425 [Streblomastix strix]|uniref:Uncharacterized protein n=1 Tax=Streblomastix strix TaxID=222440 RepID=A0A5J4X2P3_9EUKA|nr:MAG: hypothetical protein EZS28_003425 [Streblomastix strix]